MIFNQLQFIIILIIMNYNEFIYKINQYFQINNVTNDTKEKDMLIKNLQSENDALKQINSSLKSFIKNNS